MIAPAIMPDPWLDGARQPLKAVILDDDLFDRARMRRFLERSGVRVHAVEAESLEDFGRLLATTTFDLLLIDYWLPHGNGFDAFDLHLQSAKNRETAAVLVSRRAEEPLAAEAVNRGFKAFIGKDELSSARLLSVIMGLDPMQGHSSGEESGGADPCPLE